MWLWLITPRRGARGRSHQIDPELGPLPSITLAAHCRGTVKVTGQTLEVWLVEWQFTKAPHMKEAREKIKEAKGFMQCTDDHLCNSILIKQKWILSQNDPLQDICFLSSYPALNIHDMAGRLNAKTLWRGEIQIILNLIRKMPVGQTTWDFILSLLRMPPMQGGQGRIGLCWLWAGVAECKNPSLFQKD